MSGEYLRNTGSSAPAGRRRFTITATMLGAALALGLGLAGAQEAGPAPAPRLEVTLRLDRETYLLGEPVVAYVAITNRDAAPVAIDSRLDPELGVVGYWITGPDGVERRFLPHAVADSDFPKVELAPGESVYGTARLDVGGHGWTFRAPGSYALRATYRGRRAGSPPVALEISSPEQGRPAEHAATLLGSADLGAFWLFEEGDHFRGALDALRRLARERENTPLGRWAAYMLGSAFSKSFANFEERRLRPADRPRAIEHLEAVKDSLPSFYFTAKAHLLLDLDHRRLGRDDQAARVRAGLERIVAERFPDLRPWLPVIRDEVARSFERRADG